MKKVLPYLLRLIPLLVFAVFGYYLIGSNFSAKLGIIDDHEIPLFLGTDGKIDMVEIPSILKSTELGEWGKYSRFRPVYYVVRVLESALWRDNAFVWYGFRFVIFVFSIYLMWRIVSMFFPRILAYLFVFFNFTALFWADILTRLGPSEIYALPGFMLFIYSGIRLLKDNQHSNIYLAWLGLGYVICIGSKETFAFLVPILLILWLIRGVRKQVNVREIIYYLILLVFAGWVLGGIWVFTQSTQVDVYNQGISYAERVTTFFRHLRYITDTKHLYPVWLSILVATWLVIERLIKGGVKKIFVDPVFWYMVVISVVLFSIFTQYIFYNNNLPSNSRYDFPAMWLFNILSLVVVSFVVHISQYSDKYSKLIRGTVYTLLASMYVFIIITKGYTDIQQVAQANSAKTRIFQEELAVVSYALRESPESVLLIYSESPYDYEAIVSIKRYISSKGFLNPFLLNYSNNNPYDDDPLKRDLSKQLKYIQDNGSNGVFVGFVPIEELDSFRSCFSVSFRTDVETSCTDLGTF